MRTISMMAIPLLVQNYMDDLMQGGGGGGGFDDDLVAGLEEIGALSEVGAAAARAVSQGRMTPSQALQRAKQVGGRMPSPPFAQSARETERRAPLGFTQDSDGAASFTLAAAIGATTTMRAKVSRVVHVNRLNINPSAIGVVIDSIKVGDEEQALSSGAPAELYSAAAMGDSLPDNFSPLAQGLDLIIVLRNTTAGAITGTIGAKASAKR